jgi:hypothetical protein
LTREEDGVQEKEPELVRALPIVATVFRVSGSPWTRISETVPSVVGVQVISVATPAVMPL